MKKNFKKVTLTSMTVLMMVVAMVMGSTPIAVSASTPEITIVVDGRTLVQNIDTGFAQLLDGGRVFVPLRLTAAALNAEVYWEVDGPGIITMVGADGTRVYHRVGTLQAWDTPAPIANVTQPIATTDMPSFIDDGRTLVGLRLVALAFSATPSWNGETSTVNITTNTAGVPTTPPVPPAAPSAPEAPTTPATPGNTNVSAAQRNAWRPTNPAFINLALELETLAGTEVRNGNLEGVLYTIQGINSSVFAGNGILPGQQVSIHGGDGIGRWDGRPGLIAIPYTSINPLIFRNTAFHTWHRANRNSIGLIAGSNFTDMTGRESFASEVVLLTYYNVLGNRQTSGTARFNGDVAISRNEVVEIFNNLGVLTVPSGPTLDRAQGVFTGVAPAWALDGWLGTSGRVANSHMTDAQINSIVNGNITRVEAAAWMADWMDIFNYTIFEEERQALITQNFRNQVSSRFTDLNMAASYEQILPFETPMRRYNQRTGVELMCPYDVYIIMQMVDLGIMSGYADNTFRPFDTVTRGEFVEMLVRALDVQAGRFQARS